jgi:hypothetical protein
MTLKQNRTAEHSKHHRNNNRVTRSLELLVEEFQSIFTF